MNLTGFPVGIIDWSETAESVRPGTTGDATIRTHRLGDIQIRLIVYSPNYVADHWCRKGHLLFVVAGQLSIEHEQGVTYRLTPGTSYHVADDNWPPHRVVSKNGATIFLID
jgi:hypothetical protein